MPNFSEISIQSKLGRLLRLPLRFIPDDTVLLILQGPMRGQRWISNSLTHGCWLGSYEMDKQYQLAAHLQPQHCVYDIGANVGFYTLLASRRGAKVYAFEPLPRNVEFLKRHIALNHLNNVEVFPVAVGANMGMVAFQLHADHSQGRVGPEGELTVQQIALDTFVLQHNLLKPDILKIDVEGAEYDVLVGAEGLLKENHPTIFLATHGDTVHQQCVSFLQRLGYQFTLLAHNELIAS